MAESISQTTASSKCVYAAKRLGNLISTFLNFFPKIVFHKIVKPIYSNSVRMLLEAKEVYNLLKWGYLAAGHHPA